MEGCRVSNRSEKTRLAGWRNKTHSTASDIQQRPGIYRRRWRCKADRTRPLLAGLTGRARARSRAAATTDPASASRTSTTKASRHRTWQSGWFGTWTKGDVRSSGDVSRVSPLDGGLWAFMNRRRVILDARATSKAASRNQRWQSRWSGVVRLCAYRYAARPPDLEPICGRADASILQWS